MTNFQLFQIQIQDGTCILSSKTGSDVGGLYNQGLQEVHHFEMKPLLGISIFVVSYNILDDSRNHFLHISMLKTCVKLCIFY